MEIHIVQGSILDVDAQAIVNAANSRGIMGGGVAGAIRRAAGDEVDREARAHAPIPLGTAVVTAAGRTSFRAVIHAPTMPEPGMAIPPENVALATRAALQAADERRLESVAIPGMGTGVGGVAPGDAARAMMNEIRAFRPASLRRIVLVDIDPSMVEAWRKQLQDRP